MSKLVPMSEQQFFAIVYSNYQNMDIRMLGYLITELKALYDIKCGNNDMEHYIESIKGKTFLLPKGVSYVKK